MSDESRPAYDPKSFVVEFRRRIPEDAVLRGRFAQVQKQLRLECPADSLRAVLGLTAVELQGWDTVEVGRHVRELNADMKRRRDEHQAEPDRPERRAADLATASRLSAVVDRHMASIVERLASQDDCPSKAAASRRVLEVGLDLLAHGGREVEFFLDALREPAPRLVEQPVERPLAPPVVQRPSEPLREPRPHLVRDGARRFPPPRRRALPATKPAWMALVAPPRRS